MSICPALQEYVTADARVGAPFFHSVTSLFPATAIHPVNGLPFLLAAVVATPYAHSSSSRKELGDLPAGGIAPRNAHC